MKQLLLFFLFAASLALSKINHPLEVPATHENTGKILLRGTIVTPQKIITDGWILIEAEKIASISESRPNTVGAVEINTGGIIFPGLIDLHNHVSWNVFPRWQPEQKFSNRYEWRADTRFVKNISEVYNSLSRNLFCEMNTYGEIRALICGTTSILSTADAGCIRGLVRNLDYESGFYQSSATDNQHIWSKVFINSKDIQPLNCSKPAESLEKSILETQKFLNNEQSDAFLIHLSEGIDSVSLNEFCFIHDHDLLTNKTVIIHGIALGPDQFAEMYKKSASLIWSPRSNMELYGKTTNLRAALKAGIRLALSPDWGITGSNSLLDELRFASRWNHDSLGGILTDQELVKMVTEIPARIDDKVGTISEGHFADLLIISGDEADPYHALTLATAKDVQLVLISGQPFYGVPELMNSFWKNSRDLCDIIIQGSDKKIKMPDASITLTGLESKLKTALRSEGSDLASLTEN